MIANFSLADSISSITIAASTSVQYQTIALDEDVKLTLPPASKFGSNKRFIIEQTKGVGVGTLVPHGTDLVKDTITPITLSVGYPIGLISDGISVWTLLWAITPS